MANLTERYRSRIREESPIGVLMAGLEHLNYGKISYYTLDMEKP